MSHVILLTDAHEAPAYELIEALRAAGVKTLIEGLREVEVEVALAKQRKREGVADSEGPPPLAVLYEVVPGADMVELHTAIDHAKAFWPGAPLVACRRQTNGYQSHNLRSLDGATLKRLGFLAIADKSAQLPALLREIEGHGGSGELRLPENFEPPAETSSIFCCRPRSSSAICEPRLISSRLCTSAAIRMARQTLRSPVCRV